MYSQSRMFEALGVETILLSYQPLPPLLSKRMADLPRWVDRWDVDSEAMLGAYFEYLTRMRNKFALNGQSFQPVWHDHLCTVVHADPPSHSILGLAEPLTPPGLRSVPCSRPGCQRCFVRGGYQFRWFCPYWAREYNKKRREGAWQAPELPADCSVLERRRFESQSFRFWIPITAPLTGFGP